MTNMKMSREEQEAYLAERSLAIVAVPSDGRAPVVTPVLYRYDASEGIVFICTPDGEKGRRVAVGSPITVNVQDDAVKFNESYVTIEGDVSSVEPDDGLAELQRLVERYYGPEGANTYMAFIPENFALTVVKVRPKRWLSRDYAKAWGQQS
ncbi:MAG: pyridoxamine 5'-phosphate oxidase family protein [Actinomycetota bacterium]